MQKIERSIQSLKEKILTPEVKVSDLLREAKIIAYELEDKEILEWIDKELNGYKDDPVPQYRKLRGVPVIWVPNRGWVPISPSTEQDVEFIEKISEYPEGEAIPKLEEMISSSSLEGRPHFARYSLRLERTILEKVGYNTNAAIMVSTSDLSKILEAVKNKLLDWIINIAHSMNIEISENGDSSTIFPNDLIKKLPDDLKMLCDDFNFNYSHKRSFPSMLILRLLVPRAIVRKFQKLGREHEIKKQNGEYLEPEALLNKAENLIANKRCVRELRNYKFLMDTAQHFYDVNMRFEDVGGAAIRVRVFLEELFGG